MSAYCIVFYNSYLFCRLYFLLVPQYFGFLSCICLITLFCTC